MPAAPDACRPLCCDVQIYSLTNLAARCRQAGGKLNGFSIMLKRHDRPGPAAKSDDIDNGPLLNTGVPEVPVLAVADSVEKEEKEGAAAGSNTEDGLNAVEERLGLFEFHKGSPHLLLVEWIRVERKRGPKAPLCRYV